MDATITLLVRDAAGRVHRPGEQVSIVRSLTDAFGRELYLSEYSDHTRGYLFSRELNFDALERVA